MCRKNQVIGIAAIAFGIGILVGGQIGSGLWCSCVAVGVIAAGLTFLQKKA